MKLYHSIVITIPFWWGYQYEDNLVTEESEAGEEHPLAPVLVAAPGVLVVLRQVPAQRRHLPHLQLVPQKVPSEGS